MDALQLAELLNRWWPVRAGKPPPAGLGVPADEWMEHVAGYPAHTGPVSVPSAWPSSVPVLCLGRTSRGRYAVRAGDAPGATPVFPSPWHADTRPSIVLPELTTDRTPASAHRAAVVALTARPTADALILATETPGAPKRQFAAESRAYTDLADRAETALDELSEPWLADARSALSHAVTGPLLGGFPTVPVSIH